MEKYEICNLSSKNNIIKCIFNDEDIKKNN